MQSPLAPFVAGLALVASPLLQGSVQAQSSKNCKLVGSVDPGTRSCNDIWGYVAPDGKEYAILGYYYGTYFYDCSGTTPKQVGYVSGPRSIWRDMKVYGSTCYIVTEGGAGLQIVDLANPAKPAYKGTLFASGTNSWRQAHNIAMDFQRGHAYVCGIGGSTTSSTKILDVKTKPFAPTVIGDLGRIYIHDLAIHDGLAHTGEIYRGQCAIFDVNNPARPVRLDSITTRHRFTHNNWPSDDNKICVTSDEQPGGGLGVYDCSNPKDLKFLSWYHPKSHNSSAGSAIIHNAIISNRIAYIAHYTEGLEIVDLSNPKKPVAVGWYDTWPGTSRGFKGAWGVFPYTDSGRIYISDISRGLHVIEAKAAPSFYGKATAGTGGKAPEIHNFGAAWLGNSSFGIGIREAKASSPYVCFLSAGSAALNVGGLHINIDLAKAPFVFTAVTDAKGDHVQGIPLPNDTALDGVQLYAQQFVLDAAGVAGFSSTRGMRFELFKN